MEAFFRREREVSGGGARFWIGLALDHAEAAWAVRTRGSKAVEEGGMATMWDDVRAATRAVARAPRFSIFTILTLALGVGATAAVFTVLDRVVLRPLPYPGSDRMALVGIDTRHDPGSLGPLSPALVDALESTPGPTEGFAAARSSEAILLDGADPERIRVTHVSRGTFGLTGARPALGRLLDAGDYEPSAEAVVVLGHGAWQERYGGDPDVLGRTLRLDDRVHSVVGVLAAGYLPPPELVDEHDFWVPLVVDPTVTGSFSLVGLARTLPGATLEELDAHADAVVEAVYPPEAGPTFLVGATVRSYKEAVVGHVGGELERITAAVTLLLLIACVNVAGLLVTRGAERRHELGVRFALGAPRPRLVRKLLLESAVLASFGGLLGAVLAAGATELFRSYAPAGLPRLAEVALDARGLVFALAVSLLAALLFGLLPALRSTRRVSAGMRSGRGSTGSRGEARLRGGLVVVETALAVVLVVGSALLANDLVQISKEDSGFIPEGLVTMTLNLEPRFERAEWLDTWQRILDGARALPGAESVALATQAPWDGSRVMSTYRPQGYEDRESSFAISVSVAGDYLDALGTSLVEGRALRPDDEGSAPVVLVNEAFTRRFWPGEPAVGKLVHSGEEDEEVYTVVGVVADVRTRPGREVDAHVFHTLSDAPWRRMEVLVRTSGDGASLAPALRVLVRDIDPGLPVTDIRTMDAVSDEVMATPRFYAMLFGGFAAIALMLAIVGVYGTTAIATRANLREAGIRLVLGARAGQVVSALVARSGAAVAAGALLGLGGAGLASAAFADGLRHVPAIDAPTYATVALVVVATGVVAAWIPAAAAGRADPVTTLREE
jgi:putative ABC transport system permease protein